MKFLPPDDQVVLYESGFDDDLLERKKIGKYLSDVLERVEDPLVVALDGRWGTGKSYFLKRWVGAHRLQNNGRAVTVYFDAFAHDYLSDPLISLVGALSERLPVQKQLNLDRMKKAVLKFSKPAARIGLALASYGVSEALSGIWDVAAGEVKNEAEKAVNDFWVSEADRRRAMNDFRSAIEAITKFDSEIPIPLIVVVDELDRCRPDYALEVLEIIKHFFSVPHVHFVLGTNLNSLENSVKARYGLEIDATSYLQKFLSFVIYLPDEVGEYSRTLAIAKYAEHLGEVMGTSKELIEEVDRQIRLISRASHISIRDVGKIISLLNILPRDALNKNLLYGWKVVLVTLVITRVVDRKILRKILDGSLTIDEFIVYSGIDEKCLGRKEPDGADNSSYNRDVDIFYEIWRFILSDGARSKYSNFNEEIGVEKFFQKFGLLQSVKNIPKHIYLDWMSKIEIS